jgi:hypothetical protein
MDLGDQCNTLIGQCLHSPEVMAGGGQDLSPFSGDELVLSARYEGIGGWPRIFVRYAAIAGSRGPAHLRRFSYTETEGRQWVPNVSGLRDSAS